MSEFGLRKLNPVSEKYRDMMSDDIKNGRLLIEPVSQCVSCEGSELEKLLDVDRFGLPFGSFICQDCGLVTTCPRIKQESLEYYYDKYYHPLNYGKEDLQNQDSLFGSEQGSKVFNRLKSHIKKDEIDLLEVGAGVGNILKEFQERASAFNTKINVLGTEYSTKCIEKCAKIGVETIFGDAQTVVELNRTFDLVVLSHVFEHFIDLRGELERLSKLLKKDGLIYIEVPGIYRNHMNHYYDFSFLGYSVHAHMYNFTLKTLENILSANGFSMVEGDEEVYGIFRFTGEKLSANDNEYKKISNYLWFLQENQEYALARHKLIVSQESALNIASRNAANSSTKIDKLELAINNLREERAQLRGERAGLRDEKLLLKKQVDEMLAEKVRLNDEIGRQDEIVSDLIATNKSKEKTIKGIIEAKEAMVSLGVVLDAKKKHKAYKKLGIVIDASKT